MVKLLKFDSTQLETQLSNDGSRLTFYQTCVAKWRRLLSPGQLFNGCDWKALSRPQSDWVGMLALQELFVDSPFLPEVNVQKHRAATESFLVVIMTP